MVKVSFEEESIREYPEGVSLAEVLKDKDPKLFKKTVAARLDGRLVDLSTTLSDGDAVHRVEFVTIDTPEGLDVYRHSTAHLMAQAVKELFPEAKLAIGPTIEDGFYYDFHVERPFTPEDLKKIEKKMKELVKRNISFEREELPRKKALELFKKLGEDYKVELIEEMEDEKVSLYRQADFVDLCRGPHVPSTGKIKAFKLISTAGAYWRGDERNPMLQRIYGTAFPTGEELDAYLKRLEEAKKRDHRRLGKELKLFSINEEVGPGLVLWHPDGAMVRHIIEDFWKKEHLKHGYKLIYTPHIAKIDLWKTSGHWDFYRENIFSPMDVEGQEYILKPMNCPFHIQVYNSEIRSYRDLPIRYAELGTVYRYERSGVLHGLLRVRGFTQDDAHIYLRPDQLEEEIRNILKFTLYILKSFGFNEYDIYLSTRPEKYAGTLEDWQRAEDSLRLALEQEGLSYSVDPGEGVFYGPKVDIKIKDSLGRSWQCSTIQVDFNLPRRFNISYRNEEGNPSQPIMIHRALMGSVERFFGCLIEHYAGAFPVWLAPVQVVVLSVTERNIEYAEGVYRKLLEHGIRAELDKRNETLGFKIREARLRRIPFMVITGDKEEKSGLISPRSREEGELGSMRVEEFLRHIEEKNRPIEGGGDL